MMNNDPLAMQTLVEDFAKALNRSTNLSNLAGNNTGASDTFKKLNLRLQRLRRLHRQGSLPRVGVFGPPKRGKSSLLNALIGESILPTSPIPMSSTVVEIQHDEVFDHEWEVTITHENGEQEVKTALRAGEVCALIERYASHRGGSSAKNLFIRGDFKKSQVLTHGAILVDTPGAEVAFEAQAAIQEDTKRALDILEQCELVVFCVRADQLEARSDKEFYEKHLRLLTSVNIVTFLDKWQTSEDLLMETATKLYGFLRGNTRLVSNKKPSRDDSQELPDKDEVRVDPIADFLVEQTEKLKLSEGLIPLIGEYSNFIISNPKMQPESIFIVNLRQSLKKQTESRQAQKLENDLRKISTSF